MRTASSSSKARNSGFTLLEVLVAVVVLAVALSAVVKTTSEGGNTLIALRDRAFAHWVAENKLAEIQAMGTWPDGQQKGVSTMAGRDWYWRLEAKPTQNSSFRQITIWVSDQEQGEATLSVLQGFIGDPSLRKPVPGREHGPPPGQNDQPAAQSDEPPGEEPMPDDGASGPDDGSGSSMPPPASQVLDSEGRGDDS